MCGTCRGFPPEGMKCRCGMVGKKVVIGEACSGWSEGPIEQSTTLVALTRPEFQVSDHGEVERLRAEVEWLRTVMRRLAAEWSQDSHGFRQGGYDECARELLAALDGERP